MQFSTIISVLSVSAVAFSAPTLQKRECRSTIVGDVNNVLGNVISELTPLVKGVHGTVDNLGNTVPTLGAALTLLETLCV